MVLRIGDCELDLDRHELRRGGQPVSVEPQAIRLLTALVDAGDRVVAKEEFLDAVWGDRFVSESALTTQVKELRRAMGDNGRDQLVIKTVHGPGYRLTAPAVEIDRAAPAAGHGPADRPDARVSARTNPLIAVAPFGTLSAEPGRGHVADGLTHDVTAALSKHRWLRVVPRASVATFAASGDDIIGRLHDELEVHYVVEGTVHLQGDRLRITTSLTDAADGVHVWADRYDRQIDDLFQVMDEITDLIVATVEPEVGYAERARVSRSPRTTLAAWDLYHLGIAHFFRFTAEDNLEAQRLLDQCRHLDPTFADAQAWWAYATVLGMSYWDTEPDPAALDQALGATETALGLDDHNAVFHMLRGRVQLARREYGRALADNKRAIDLNPTFAAAYCGLGDSLCYEGAYDEAIEQFSRAVSIGTHDPQRWAFLSYGALALIFAGRYGEAVEWADQAMAIPNCQYWSWAHKAVALAQLGEAEEAGRTVRALMDLNPAFTIEFARRKLFFLKRPEQLEQYLTGLARAGVQSA